MGSVWLTFYFCQMTVFQCLIKNITLTSNSDGWKMWLEVTLGPSKKDLGRATAHDVVLSGKLRINQFLFCVDQECFKWEINILRAQGVRPRQWALCPGWHWKNGRSVFVATGWLRLVHTPWFPLLPVEKIQVPLATGLWGLHWLAFYSMWKSIFKALLWDKKHFS